MVRRVLLLLLVALLSGPGLRAQTERADGATADPAADAVGRWLAAHAIRLETVEPGGSIADLEGLHDIVGDARIVLLGEPTHGNREVYRLKHRMLAFLVEEMGFDVLALETPMAESFDVHDYVATGVGTPETVLAATHVWPWDTEEVAEMLAWMRRTNADPTNGRKVAFYGFDMQSSERAARVTLAYLDRVDPALAARARRDLGHLAIPFSDPDAGGYRPIVARDADARVQDAIAAVMARFDARREAWSEATGAEAWAFARQHARLLEQWVEASRDDGRAFVEVRDPAMAENIRWILEREGPDAKVVVWAHNSHLTNTRAPERWGDLHVAGYHLRQTFGSEVVIVGILFNRGSFRALEVAVPSRGLWAFDVGPAPEGTVEAMFAAADLELAAVDLRRLPATGPVADWFGAPRRIRHSGGGYDVDNPDYYFHAYVMPEAFDALVYVDATTPMRPIEPADYGAFPVLAAPVNLDFEHGVVGDAPAGWLVWSKLRRFGFEVATTDDEASRGDRAARIHRAPGRHVGEASGSVLQRVDAAAFRGRRVRLRAAARAELADDGLAFLRLRVHPPESGEAHAMPDVPFDSLDEVRVTSPEWQFFEIVADVPEGAGSISYGLFLAGAGTAWLDAVSLDVGEE